MSSRTGAKAAKVSIDAYKLAQEKWEGSGLTNEHAAKLKFEALDPAQTSALGEEFHTAYSLKIPYFDTFGKPTKFFRVRYLGTLPGFAGLVEKPQRYAQPKGTLNEIYFPPLLDMTWATIAEDPSIDVWITEGELKAAAACAQGIPCLGLGGVDMWQAKGKGFDILPPIHPDRFKWTKRNMYLCFDSDAATKDTVLAASLRLVKRLHAEGAVCHIVGLPAGPEGAKVGLDDYLLAHGVDDLMALANASRTYAASEALWEMNERSIVILDPPCIWDRKSYKAISVKNFKELSHAHRHFNEIIIQPNGNTTIKVRDTAIEWLKWGSRFELDGFTYEPGKPAISGNKLNMWRGWGVPSVPGDVSPWHEMMDFVFRKNKREREYFERWVAYAIQFPGTKMFVSVVLWGTAQGTGKSLIGETIGLIYGENYAEITNKQLTASFNTWAERKQFVVMDEITGGMSRDVMDYVKGLITQQYVRINTKYVNEYVLPDCINYLHTSNHPDLFTMDDFDRRFFIWEVAGPPMPDEFYTRFRKWKENGGAAHLRYYFENLPLGDFDPRAKAMETNAKLAMIEDGRSDLGTWVAALRRDPTRLLGTLGKTIAEECDLFTPTMLLTAYTGKGDNRRNVTANGLGRELKRQGVVQLNHGLTIHTNIGACRLYAVRNADKWITRPLTECAAHFNKFCQGAQ